MVKPYEEEMALTFERLTALTLREIVFKMGSNVCATEMAKSAEGEEIDTNSSSSLGSVSE